MKHSLKKYIPLFLVLGLLVLYIMFMTKESLIELPSFPPHPPPPTPTPPTPPPPPPPTFGWKPFGWTPGRL